MNDMSYQQPLSRPGGPNAEKFRTGFHHGTAFRLSLRDSVQLSIVVPCYNEEDCLNTLYERLCGAASAAVGEDFEIIMVDDGSRDRTWSIISALGETDARVCAVRLSRNHGHQIALSAGLDQCRGDLILIIDADLQDPPELLGAMIGRLREEEADVVYGVRSHRQGETAVKRTMAKVFYRLLAHVSDGVEIPLDTGDFRLMTRRAHNVLQSMPEQSRFIRGMVAWIGFRQVAYSYERDERLAGTTKYPFMKMCRLAIDALTGFSIAPLRMASYAGLVFSVVAMILIGYALTGWVGGRAVEGWTSLMIASLVMGSVQMFLLGVVGEYIGRIYNQAKNRPLYIVSEMVGGARLGDRCREEGYGLVAPLGGLSCRT